MIKNRARACAWLIAWFALQGISSPAWADGLPGEYLLSSRWRDLMWWHSPLTNPAFMTEEQMILIRGAFAPTLQGEFKLWEAGITVPVGLFQSFGVSAIGENDGVIENATFDDASGRMALDGTHASNNNIFGMLSYAIVPWNRLSLGVNLNTAYQTGFGSSRKGIGLDFGCAYRFLQSEKWGDHLAGISTINLVAPAMSTGFISGTSNGGEYSRDLKLSWIGSFWNRQIESGLDLDMRDFWSKTREFQDAGSLSSVAQKLEWGANWRIGAWIMKMAGLYFQLGFDERGAEYWGLAGGARMPLTEGQNISMFYQYNIKTEGDWASSHTVYLLMNIGKHRDSQGAREGGALGERPELADLKRILGIRVEDDKESYKIVAEEVAIHFESGSAQMTPEAIKALQGIARFVRAYPDHPVRIEGHTDNDPISGKLKEKYPDNLSLSKARAEQVKNYLVTTENIPGKSFTTVGFGDTRPLVPNDTKENKYKNRRVIIVVRK